MLKFLLIFILALNLNAGFIWNTTKSVAKTGVVYGVKKVTQIAKTKKVHGNSLNYKGDTHVYKITNKDKVFKVGESGQGTNLYEKSKRAEQQVRKLQKETGDSSYESKIIKNFDNKQDARAYEKKLIERTRSRYGEDKNDKSILTGNKTNR